MENWIHQSIFYHIYPFGFCGAPQQNDFRSAPCSRLNKVTDWLDHLQWLGINTLYLGPVFESTAHGYDTADYYHVDRRLGTNTDLERLAQNIHNRGIRLVLDGVFNHVGRDFWAFKDVLANGRSSPFCDWFSGLNFEEKSPLGDPFTYDVWNGHYDLVKLNLKNSQVIDHLLYAVESWVQDYQIDGIRLDAADQLDMEFIETLSTFCKRLRPDFWLMGELIHGDYARWTRPGRLDSATNYECYKGLFSSHNDKNYFEIAHSLKRQFGERGIYQNLLLYSFADNHDVDRVASVLKDPVDLFNLYTLLFCMPGVPSIYYGSEWGLQGRKTYNSDSPLRPEIDLAWMIENAPQPELPKHLALLARIRLDLPAIQSGKYQQIVVASQQFAFLRGNEGQRILVAVNSSDKEIVVPIPLEVIGKEKQSWIDHLNPGIEWVSEPENFALAIPAKWGRILEQK